MHIAAQAGHPDTALVFLKKGVPLHMPNKVNKMCSFGKLWHENNITFNIMAVIWQVTERGFVKIAVWKNYEFVLNITPNENGHTLSEILNYPIWG